MRTQLYFVFVVTLLCLIEIANSWVFTEINPKMLKDLDEIDGEAIVDEENELNEFAQERFALIYPGTKWCGTGDIADSYDDLGSSKEADACCRDHDHCPDVILAGETKHNLTNEVYYSRLSCKCDMDFHQCLHNANTNTARRVGKMYFTLIGTKCFKNEYPITGCTQYSGWLNNKCVEYTYDTNSEKQYQWFDVPNY